MSSLFSQFLTLHKQLFEQIGQLEPQLTEIAASAADVLKRGGRLFFCGNGGSAADAQHLAAELVGRLVDDRKALKAIALTTDSSALTCIGNDFGYDYVFARQLEGLASPGDMILLITTSGNSQNLILAAQAAKELGVTSVGFLGKGGGQIAPLVDHALIVPPSDTARTQEAHIFLGHSLCAQLEANLGLGKWTS
jgi:D-sedoheptulose 7-phosphate isomerase